MLLFAYYLLKVSLVSGLLYAYYFVALRNKKFHQYNRFYLLVTVLLSLIIPLIKIDFLNYSIQRPIIIKTFSVLNNTDVYVTTATAKQNLLSDYNQIAMYVFLVVTAVVFFFLVSQVIKIFILIRGNPKKVWNDVCFVFTKNPGTPFSFFKYIFWDENINIGSREGRDILQHELTHVKQNHSADKLFLNIVLTAGWANPFFWIIRNELNMLHEFIADQKAISNGDSNAFAVMLLTATYPQHSFALTHSFFHSPIKRRLLMITSSTTTSFSFARRVMILPVLSLILVLPTFKIEAKNLGELQTFEKDAKKTIQSGDLNEQKSDLIKESFSDTIEAKFPGGDQAWKKYLETNLDANVPVTKDKAPTGIYTVKLEFVVTETGEINSISAAQVPERCPSCAVEAVRIIKNGPKWDPMTIDGKKATCKQFQFISFQVQKD